MGDILNYGPRNGLPEGLDPKGIAEMLNKMADQIIAIRGNCDSEVDQMLLDFPILADYALIADNGKRLFLTHGHVYNEEKCLRVSMTASSMDIRIYGNWNTLEVHSFAIRARLLFPKEATCLPSLSMKTGK